jgi:hypothetical protein
MNYKKYLILSIITEHIAFIFFSYKKIKGNVNISKVYLFNQCHV